MTDEADDWNLPCGWTVWSDARDRVVLAYRPDVFDGSAFPAPCLPTIYVSRGKRDRRPGGARTGRGWYVTLFLEPDVSIATERFDSEEVALDGARDLAARFATGDVDYRDAYQVPRPDYFDRLDELTGREA